MRTIAAQQTISQLQRKLGTGDLEGALAEVVNLRATTDELANLRARIWALTSAAKEC